MSHKTQQKNRRAFAFGLIAVALAALACRQSQPGNDPKPSPNSPLPKVERPDSDEKSSGPPTLLSRDGG